MDADAAEIEVEGTEPETDKDRNFRLLREKVAAMEAELAELRPLRADKKMREAGYDPSSPVGKAIGLLVRSTPDAVPETPEQFREWIVSELGFAPVDDGKIDAAASFADRMDQVSASSTSDRSLSIDDEIAEAEKAGNWRLVAQLKTRQVSTLA